MTANFDDGGVFFRFCLYKRWATVPPPETWEEAKARNWQVILILLAMSMVQVVKEEPEVQVAKEEQGLVVQVTLAYPLVPLS